MQNVFIAYTKKTNHVYEHEQSCWIACTVSKYNTCVSTDNIGCDYLGNIYSRGRWGNGNMRGKAVFCHIRKTKNGKKLLLGQQLQLTITQIGTKKWVIWLYLIRRLPLLLVFRVFNLTFQQDKKCLVFFSRKNISKSQCQ